MANNDRIYAAYMGEMGETLKRQTRERIEWILQQVQGRKTILDIGCSQGIISILCAQQGGQVTGIEIQKENYDFANHLLNTEYNSLSDSVRFINQDFMQYDEDVKYDAVILTEVLEHLPNAEEFLAHAAQFLSEEGIVVITVPFSYCPHPDHIYTFYLTSLMELVKKIFCIEEVYYIGRWMGCVAGRGERDIELDKDLFVQEEAAFLQLHKDMEIRMNDLTANLANVNQRLQKFSENYYRMREWYDNEKQKNTALTENYSRMKEWYENSLNKVREVTEAYERMKQWREDEHQKLLDVIEAEHQQMLIMQKAKKTIQKQQTEIQILCAENESYKQKLSVIYDTWYGKIAMKCYKFLKKVKRKLLK